MHPGIFWEENPSVGSTFCVADCLLSEQIEVFGLECTQPFFRVYNENGQQIEETSLLKYRACLNVLSKLEWNICRCSVWVVSHSSTAVQSATRKWIMNQETSLIKHISICHKAYLTPNKFFVQCLHEVLQAHSEVKFLFQIYFYTLTRNWFDKAQGFLESLVFILNCIKLVTSQVFLLVLSRHISIHIGISHVFLKNAEKGISNIWHTF